MSVQSSSVEGCAREKTHVCNEISARVVVFVENNTVVVVASKLGLRASKIHVFLEEQGTLDVFASMLTEKERKYC